MTYRIIRVDGEDEETADTLRWLHESTFADSAPMPHFDKGFWWCVMCAKDPIGFAGMRKAAYTKDVGYLKRSGVLSGHRGHGLQRRLIRAREVLARKLGWRLLLTDTTHNPRSANTLISAGYRMYTPAHPWGPEGACYWRKKIG